MEQNPSLIEGYPLAILTPNVNEFGRLCDKILDKEQLSLAPEQKLMALATKYLSFFVPLLLTFVCSPSPGSATSPSCRRASTTLSPTAGRVRLLAHPSPSLHLLTSAVVRCEEEGGLKRCGGQGDVLAGAIGTFAAWASFQAEQLPPSDITPLMLAAYGGCTLLKSCAKRAFANQGRAMLAADLLPEVGGQFRTLFDEH